jgi:hypothetical protein
LEGHGSVAPPRDSDAPSDSPHTIRYTASAHPRKGHGVGISALTRAGLADGKWQIADAGFEGSFSQTSESSFSAGVYGISGGSTYKITGRLVWSPDPNSTRAHSFGDVGSTFYVPTDGEIVVAGAHSEGKSVTGKCVIEGSKSFPIRSLPPVALEYLVLEVATDGRYRLMLGMISRYLQFNGIQQCTAQAAPGYPIALPGGGRQPVTINDAGIQLGRHEGTLVDDSVAGKIETPISDAGRLVTGEWQFKRSQASSR